MTRSTRAVLACMVLLSATSAWGAEASEFSGNSSSVTAAGRPPLSTRPFTLFAGVGGGYGLLWGDSYGQAPGGAHLLLSALGAVQVWRWEFDGGFSWLYSSVSGHAQAGVPISVHTRAGTFDLGARYRLSERWQIGPALNLAFGTDTGFGPSVGDSQGELFIGAKAVYEFARPPFPLRVWMQISTDTASSNHLAFALVGVQIGIPLRFSRDSGQQAELARSEDRVRVSSAAPNRQVRIVLDSQKVFFGTMSAALKPEVSAALKDVGRFLGAKADERSEIVIAGHADQRGRYEYNLKLSRKRAESVRKALEKGGADPAALNVEAFSYLALLDKRNTKDAWAKNRRVEITFENVRDPEGLRKQLAPLASQSPGENR